jgi:hypothetical protein
LLPSCSGGDSAPTSFIPEGTYELKNSGSKSVKTGVKDTTFVYLAPRPIVLVKMKRDLTVFTFSGTFNVGPVNSITPYSCDKRVWEAKIARDGTASAISRTEEKCSDSIDTKVWEALRRTYKVHSVGFTEIVSDGSSDTEYVYERMK